MHCADIIEVKAVLGVGKFTVAKPRNALRHAHALADSADDEVDFIGFSNRDQDIRRADTRAV